MAARGLWIDMICLMHEAEPYGYLLVNGHPVTDRMLVALTGTDESTLAELKRELETNGVYSVNNKGVIYSRRMTRFAKKAKTNTENGKKGGAAKHKKRKGKSGLGNRKSSEHSSPRGYMPDTSPNGEVAPDGYRYRGKVMNWKDDDWSRERDKRSLTEKQFLDFINQRDDWLAGLPDDDKRKSAWWMPTIQQLDNETEGIRKSCQ